VESVEKPEVREIDDSEGRAGIFGRGLVIASPKAKLIPRMRSGSSGFELGVLRGLDRKHDANTRHPEPPKIGFGEASRTLLE